MKRTKVIATIGPAINNEEKITELIKVGVDIFRFNFSHGTHEEHFNTLKMVRDISNRLGKYVATLMDLSGPKIRLGEISKPIQVKLGDTIFIEYGNFIGNECKIPLPIEQIFKAVKVGDVFYIADGTVKLQVVKSDSESILAKVLSNGIVSSKKGLNLPNINLNIEALTDKDKADIEFGVKAGFDIIALSFVSNKDDILSAKEIIKKYNSDIPVIAKIEKIEAINNIDKIIEVSDGIMVARGDLGIEIEVERVPVIQKEIIKKANEAAKPVITATQMLLSMIKHSRPTRAEVSDIANAVLDGTDAVMLSDETTIGEFPVEAVQVMVRTIKETETIYPYYKFYHFHDKGRVSSAIAESAVKLAKDITADGIVVFTKSGSSARRVSSCRPRSKILAISTTPEVLRRLSLSWGIIPYLVTSDTNDADQLLKNFMVKSANDFGKDKIFIATVGYPSGIPGSTNVIRTIRKQDYDYFFNKKE